VNGGGAGSAEHAMADVEIRLSGPAGAYIIKNLWPLDQHDVSEFRPTS
jgi:hypothetical protein